MPQQEIDQQIIATKQARVSLDALLQQVASL